MVDTERDPRYLSYTQFDELISRIEERLENGAHKTMAFRDTELEPDNQPFFDEDFEDPDEWYDEDMDEENWESYEDDPHDEDDWDIDLIDDEY